MEVSNETIGNAKHPASSNATVATPSRPEAKNVIPLWKAVAPVAIAVVLALLPVPSGLNAHAWYFFSIFVGVIVGLILEPLPGAAIALIGMTVVAVLGRFALFSPQQLSEPGFHGTTTLIVCSSSSS